MLSFCLLVLLPVQLLARAVSNWQLLSCQMTTKAVFLAQL